MRRLAPTEGYGRRWITHLLSRKILESKTIQCFAVGRDSYHSLLIKTPASVGSDGDGFKSRLLKKIKTILASDFEFTLHLKEFSIELAACECVEYINYYAQKSRLKVVDVEYDNPQLKLLLLECKQPQVFMVLWRAIKFSERDYADLNGEVKFRVLIENAFDCFIKYKKSGVVIESYEKPRCMNTSALVKWLKLLSSLPDVTF